MGERSYSKLGGVESVAQGAATPSCADATVRLQRQFHGNDDKLEHVKGGGGDGNLRPVMMR